jgi:CRISPR-associated exonuclease Cas4
MDPKVRAEPSESDAYLPLSALEHLLYCERQCALIHVDGIWIENVHTTAGRQLHERVDAPDVSRSDEVIVARAVPVRSDVLRLFGIADVVEFRGVGEHVVPYPVEYKRGARKSWLHDEVQLAAQAMALEEMTGVAVAVGAIFYGKSKRRREVAIDGALRAHTRAAAGRLHEIIGRAIVPAPVADERCEQCSLRPACVPEVRFGDLLLASALRKALR